MTRFLVKAAVVGTVLGALGFAVAAGDREMFVPPPESVAESFGRQLAAGRYDRALPFLSRNAAASTDAAALEMLARELEQSVGSAILDVTGEPIEMRLDIAQARARVRGRGLGETTITFALVREKRLWKIDGWTR